MSKSPTKLTRMRTQKSGKVSNHQVQIIEEDAEHDENEKDASPIDPALLQQ